MASTYLTKTSPTAGNRTKGTISVWVKRSSLGSYQNIYVDFYSTDNFAGVRFNNSDTLGVFSYSGGSAQLDINTNRKFRDTNAWYHIVVAWDTTDGTASDRIKIYINGERETSFSGSPTYPTSSQQIMFGIGGSYPIVIGRRGTDNAEYFDGSMSHFHRVDNQALAPTVFGSTDSTTGEWKISTSPSITYTGSSDYNFFILKDGNSVTDQSGQSNNLTVGGGTLTKTEDCPSSVFATLDAIQYKTSALTYSNGNTTVSFPSAWVFALSQWGVSSGKWYWEAKCNSGNNANSFYGICAEMVPTGNGFYNNSQNGAIMYKVGSGETYIDATNNASGYSPSINNTDIVGLALDLDSGTKTLKIYKNGTLLSSGGTINLSSYYNDTLVFPCFSGNSSSASCSFNVNFGNGYFGGTAISSAGTNASNNGIFEYDVPTGYTALSTKGLNL
jgi:hypothetical protein